MSMNFPQGTAGVPEKILQVYSLIPLEIFSPLNFKELKSLF